MPIMFLDTVTRNNRNKRASLILNLYMFNVCYAIKITVKIPSTTNKK